MFSIICVYNNKQVLDAWLLRSLSNQTREFELILLDNTQKKYTSATEALNSGGKSAKNDYLLFVHQDIDFLVDTWLEKAEEFLGTNSRRGYCRRRGNNKRWNYVQY